MLVPVLQILFHGKPTICFEIKFSVIYCSFLCLIINDSKSLSCHCSDTKSISLFLLLCFLSSHVWIRSDTDISLDPQVPFIPSVEILVKALLMMSSAAMKVAPDSFVRIILCSHHPCVVGSAKRVAVWKVLLMCCLILLHDTLYLFFYFIFYLIYDQHII
jgi:uncharacterized membrane protein